MSERLDPVGDDELHALVDGQLDPARAAAVRAWLNQHPEDAERVAVWQQQRLALRRLAREIDLDETPAALSGVVLRAAAADASPAPAGTPARGRGWQALAAALLLAVGVLAGWTASHLQVQWQGDGLVASRVPTFVREASLAHAVFVPERRHAVEVSAAEEAHLVAWLGKRLDTNLKAPTLLDQGFRLLGGRLLPGQDGGPRAQFMYENAKGERLTLFIAVFKPGEAPAPTSFRSVRDAAGESFYWVEDRFGYALSAPVPPAELQTLARIVYEQLTR